MSAPATAGRIVVGTDLSVPATAAVDWAAARASELGQPLLILIAVPKAPLPERAEMDNGVADFRAYVSEATAAAVRSVGAEADRVRARHPELTVETAVAVDVSSFPLARATKDAALVVVGSRGYSAQLKTAALGGTADAVATHAHGPVAVIPEFASANLDVTAPDDRPVVVGVDDSPEALGAIQFAAAEAARRGVPLIGLHAWRAWPWLTETLVGWSAGYTDVGAGLDAMVRDLVAPYLAEGQAFESRVVGGHPAVQLVEASKDASLLVVGSRGRGGFAGLLLGSTSRETLRLARCPVVVIRRRPE